jgi:glycerophosphoryl diester phosphodiesterase
VRIDILLLLLLLMLIINEHNLFFFTLQKVPTSVGFNIEIKYPFLVESEKERLDVAECNKFVDAILKVVFDHAGERKIVFSSFHAESCRMAKLKQVRSVSRLDNKTFSINQHTHPIHKLRKPPTLTSAKKKCISLLTCKISSLVSLPRPLPHHGRRPPDL